MFALEIYLNALRARNYYMKYGKPTPTQSTPGLSENDKILQLTQAIVNLVKDNRTTDEPLTAFPDGKVLKPTLYLRKTQETSELGVQSLPVLQQKWLDTTTGEEHWRDVPIVVTETFTVIPEPPEAPIEESPLSSPSEEIKTPSSTTPVPANGIVEGEA